MTDEKTFRSARALIEHAVELFEKCDDGPYVKNVLEETYTLFAGTGDECECDGYSLLEDMQHFLAYEAPKPEANQ